MNLNCVSHHSKLRTYKFETNKVQFNLVNSIDPTFNNLCGYLLGNSSMGLIVERSGIACPFRLFRLASFSNAYYKKLNFKQKLSSHNILSDVKT